MSPYQIMDSQRQRPTPYHPLCPRGGPGTERMSPPEDTEPNQTPKASGLCKYQGV